MSDDESDVQVCDICQEILLGVKALQEHIQDEHQSTKGKEKLPEAPHEKESPETSNHKTGEISEKKHEKKRSRDSSPERPEKRKRSKSRSESPDLMKQFMEGLNKDKKGDSVHKMKKKKHRDRSRERHNDSFIDDEDYAKLKSNKIKATNSARFQGAVNDHDNTNGPECPKCGQVCKDLSNMKNHLLSHYYQDFYRVTPDCKPFPCPSCGKENRDRITMIRHYAFSHNMLFELTDVTPEDVQSTGRAKPVRKIKVDDDSRDISKKKKSHSDEPTRSSFGKHHKEHKHKKDKKHKEHKKRDETEEERRIRKAKKREQREKEKEASKSNGRDPLTSLLKELTPESNHSVPTDDPNKNGQKTNNDERAPETPQESESFEQPHAAGQEDGSDDDDFGDLPAPVFAE